MKFTPEEFSIAHPGRGQELADYCNAKLEQWLKAAPVVKTCKEQLAWVKPEALKQAEQNNRMTHTAKLVEIEEIKK